MSISNLVQSVVLAGFLEKHPADFIVYIHEKKKYQLFKDENQMIIPAFEVPFEVVKSLMRMGVIEFKDGIFEYAFKDVQ